MLNLILVVIATIIMISFASAGEIAPPTPEGVYLCLQNTAMTGSVWSPAECKHLASIEDQIKDRAGQPVIALDHVDPNPMGDRNIWWKIDFRGVGVPTDKTTHWFCSARISGFACVWQTANNPEDWAVHNQLRDVGMTDIPSVFSISNELVGSYLETKPIIALRKANESRYAKAEALSKCRSKIMLSVGNRL